MLEKVNALYPRLMNNLQAPTYIFGQKNHPNFSWNHGQYKEAPNSNITTTDTGQLPKSNVGVY